MVTADNDRAPLLVLMVGLLGVSHDCWAAAAAASWMNFHAVFGALLWVTVVARFYGRMHRAPRMLPADVRTYARHLSRLVYLLLYVLLFFSLIIGILHGAPHRTSIAAAEDSQGYLACGIVALVTIQALSALCHRSVIRAAASAPMHGFQGNGRLT